MKIATVYYEGPGRRLNRRGPSDERYTFSKGQFGAPDIPAEVYSVEDALQFARSDNFRVEWSPMGRIAKLSQSLDAPATEIGAMLSEMGYRQKQNLAKKLGLKAGGTEEELEERLKPEVEELRARMEEEL